MKLTGDVRGKFTELSLFDVPTFDRDGPILIRNQENAPCFHVVSALQSDHTGTRERYHLAYDARLSPLGTEVLARAINDYDAIALAEVGRFMLYEIGVLAQAFICLQQAYTRGASDAALDLAVAALYEH